MIAAFKLAGFFAAHAIWCVSLGDTLTPMLAHATEGERRMDRLVDEDLPSAVEFGRGFLRSNEMEADEAVLVYDGRTPITLPQGKVDAILLEIRTYASPKSEAMLAVPYTPKESGEFRVHKPKLLVWKNCDDFDLDPVLSAFFEGVHDHEKGAQIWNESLDESM